MSTLFEYLSKVKLIRVKKRKKGCSDLDHGSMLWIQNVKNPAVQRTFVWEHPNSLIVHTSSVDGDALHYKHEK